MRTCPAGHQSASDDFCDECGLLIDAVPALNADPAPGTGAYPDGAGLPASGQQPAAQGEPCPRCGTARSGQFCEACGYSFATAVRPPASPAPAPEPAAPEPAPAPAPDPADRDKWTEWTAVVTADRAYYDRIQAADGPDAAAIPYPEDCQERRFPLRGTQVRVGRRSVSRHIDPEIDLTGPPSDPGVSRLHAVLLPGSDDTWSVVDPGSANGVLVNGQPIAPGEAVTLHAGDRIHLGAWTALTISRG